MSAPSRWSRTGPLLVALAALSAVMFASVVSDAKPKRQPRGTGGYFRYGLGLGGCTGDSSLCTPEVGVGFAPVDMELGYRPGILAMEVAFNLQSMTYDTGNGTGNGNVGDSNQDGTFDTGMWGIYGGLKLMPQLANRFDPYVGLRVGYAQLTVPQLPGNKGDEGLSLGLVGGFDYFLTKGFALGLSTGYYTIEAETERHSVVVGRASLILYFDFLSGSSSSKSPPPKKTPKRTPKKKKKKQPSY